MAAAAKASRPSGLEVGDHLYVRHPTRGPIAVKVKAAGRDGLIGLCDKGERHKVAYDAVLGAKERVPLAYSVVDAGADGAIVQDATGRRRYLQHPGPGDGDAVNTSQDTGPVSADATPSDPLLDGLDLLGKARPMSMLPEGARVLFVSADLDELAKAGPIANRPGLSLKDVTDRTGRRSKHWVRTNKPVPGQRRAGARDDAPAPSAPMRHGDVVNFRHGDVEGKGRIVGSGRDGVTVHDGQREHQVRHEHLIGRAPDSEQAPGGAVSSPIAPRNADMAPNGEQRVEKPSYAPRQDGEADKAYAKRVIDKMSSPAAPLPEDHGKYFHMDQGHEMVPIDKLTSTKTDDENKQGGDNGPKRMLAAYHGVLGKRDPIEAEKQADGSYKVTDGNGTFTSAKAQGWKHLPVKVSNAAAAPAVSPAESSFFKPDQLKGLKPSSAVTQPFHDQEALYKASGEALGELKGWLNQGEGICSQLGYQTMGVPPEDADLTKPGGMLFIAPLKGEKRAKDKVKADYGGDWSKLKDTVRCTIAVDTMDDIKDVVDALQKGGMQLAQQPKDKFAKPTPEGYRDLNLSVKFKNGLIGEVQVHLKSMLLAKADGHKPYEVMRTIDGKPREQWSDQDKAHWQAAFAESQAIYSKAWAGSRSKPGTPDEKQEQPMKKAMDGADGAAWEFYERDGAQFRRPAGEPGGVTDVLQGRTWKPYMGDRTRAYLEGDKIEDPLGGGGGGSGGGDRGPDRMSKAMASGKGAKRSLYIHRKVTNGAEIAKHYRDQGCSPVVDPSDMHCTQCYSKTPVDWDAMGDAPDKVTVPAGGRRRTAPLGDKGAHVLHFDAPQLEGRHDELMGRGASHDFPSFKPHVTVSYGGKGFDKAKPWTGPIKMGPEVKQPIKEGWKPMQKAIGFFKAIIQAQGQSSLFATPVTVKEHTTKDGVHVPAHTAIVHKRAPEPAGDDAAASKVRRLAALSNRHTAYEAVVHHADGRKHLLAYVTGKSGQKLRDAMMKRALHVQRATGAGEDLRATPESPNKILLHGRDGLHGKRYGHVTWSGRTQRDAIMGGEHDYIGQAEAPAAASEASDDDDGPGAAEFKELERKHAERMATADRLADAGKPVRMANPRYSHLTQLVSPDVSEPGKWRMTTFGSDRQPVGHVTLDTAKQAFRLALQEGNDPVAEPPRVIVRKEPVAAPPAPKRERRGMVSPGDLLRSVSGRQLSPVPKFNALSNGGPARGIKAINGWLLDEARKEAEATDNDWNITLLRGLDPKRMSQSDQDTVNMMLFGDPDGPGDEHRMPTAPVATSPRKAMPDADAAAQPATLQNGFSATYYRNDKTHKTAIHPTREEAAAEAFAKAPKPTRSVSTAIARDGMHTGSDIRFHNRRFAAPAPRMVVRKDPGPEWHSATMAKMKTLPDESLRYIAKDAAEAARLNPDSSKAGRYADESHYASMELAARRDGRSAAPPVAQRDAKHFYVSAIDGKKRHLVAGPYHSHDAAKGMVEHVKRHAEEVQPDKAHPWVAWGTAGSSEPMQTPLSESWTPDSVSSYELGRTARHHDHPREANPVPPQFATPARDNWHKGWDEADQMIRGS